jgi:hypothetical protein
MMTSRRFLTTIGATALGLGIVIGGGPAVPSASAQETTPAVEAPAQAAQTNDPEARLAQPYDDFVAALAKELNADESTVDAAIRTALKDQVAAQETAGNLDVDQVAEIQARIDDADAPLFLGFGGPGGMHGFGGPGGGFKGFAGEHRGPRGGSDDERGQKPGGMTPPATLPSVGDAAGQSEMVPALPTDSAVSS